MNLRDPTESDFDSSNRVDLTPQQRAEFKQYQDNLDWRSLRMLAVIQTSGGEATTTEIRETLDFEYSQSIHYRYEKLEDRGLIKTEQPDPEEAGLTPPKIARTTERGDLFVQSAVFNSSPPPDAFEDRLDRLESIVGELVEELAAIETGTGNEESESRGPSSEISLEEVVEMALADELPTLVDLRIMVPVISMYLQENPEMDFPTYVRENEPEISDELQNYTRMTKQGG